MRCSATKVVWGPEVVLFALCCDLDFLVFGGNPSRDYIDAWWKVPIGGLVLAVLVARLRCVRQQRLLPC